jgi:hypothetical protein
LPFKFNLQRYNAVIRKHLPAASLSSDVGAELSFTLPSDGTSKFATLFQELDGELARLGWGSARWNQVDP